MRGELSAQRVAGGRLWPRSRPWWTKMPSRRRHGNGRDVWPRSRCHQTRMLVPPSAQSGSVRLERVRVQGIVARPARGASGVALVRPHYSSASHMSVPGSARPARATCRSSVRCLIARQRVTRDACESDRRAREPTTGCRARHATRVPQPLVHTAPRDRGRRQSRRARRWGTAWGRDSPPGSVDEPLAPRGRAILGSRAWRQPSSETGLQASTSAQSKDTACAPVIDAVCAHNGHAPARTFAEAPDENTRLFNFVCTCSRRRDATD